MSIKKLILESGEEFFLVKRELIMIYVDVYIAEVIHITIGLIALYSNE